jgi:hypothetical protein
VLKDDPAFVDHLQPTRDNIVSALFSSSLSISPDRPDLALDFGQGLNARIEEPRCKRDCRGPFHVSLSVFRSFSSTFVSSSVNYPLHSVRFWTFQSATIEGLQ